MKTLLLVCIATTCLFFQSFTQTKPFPQNVNYGNGYKPPSWILDHNDVQSTYNSWKSDYVRNCEGGKRVEGDQANYTFSEGQGYGMVIAAYMGDKALFDDLWQYAQARQNEFGNMGWKTTCNSGNKYYDCGDSGNFSGCQENGQWGAVSATDGDLDIALGLCIAADQWEGSYTQQAIGYINNLKANNFRYVSSAGRWIQEHNDGSNNDFGNTSYWSPGVYRVFKDFTGDNDWNAIINDTYDILFDSRNANTGFAGNEVYANGNTKKNWVDYNGARSPWRWVVDYLWTGNGNARNLVNKMTDWANGQGIENVVDGYFINGTIRNGATWTQSPPWTGAWACGAMAKNQSVLNEFTQHFNSSTHDNYYSTSLRLLYQLVLTGNYWRPEKPSGGGNTNCNDGLLQNGCMEDGTGSWNGGGTETSVSNPKRGGTKSIRVTGRSKNGQGLDQNIKNDLTSNGQGLYAVEAWVRTVSGNADGRIQLHCKSGNTWRITGELKASVNSNGWTKIYGRIPAFWSGGLQDAKIRIRTTDKNKNYYVDDAKMTFVGGNNYISNPGFESSSHFPWKGGSSETRTTNPKRSGTYSGRKYNVTNNNHGMDLNTKQLFLAKGKGNYYVEAYMRNSTSNTTGYVELWTRTNNSWTKKGFKSSSINSNGWTKISGTLSINWSGSLQNARIRVRNANSTEFYVDDVILRKSGSSSLNHGFEADILTEDSSQEQEDFHSLSTQFGFTLSPNPVAGDNLMVSFQGLTSDEPVSLKIMDLRGRAIQHHLFRPNLDQTHREIKLESNIPNGVYLLLVEKNGRVETKRFSLSR